MGSPTIPEEEYDDIEENSIPPSQSGVESIADDIYEELPGIFVPVG